MRGIGVKMTRRWKCCRKARQMRKWREWAKNDEKRRKERRFQGKFSTEMENRVWIRGWIVCSILHSSFPYLYIGSLIQANRGICEMCIISGKWFVEVSRQMPFLLRSYLWKLIVINAMSFFLNEILMVIQFLRINVTLSCHHNNLIYAKCRVHR